MQPMVVSSRINVRFQTIGLTSRRKNVRDKSLADMKYLHYHFYFAAAGTLQIYYFMRNVDAVKDKTPDVAPPVDSSQTNAFFCHQGTVLLRSGY